MAGLLTALVQTGLDRAFAIRGSLPGFNWSSQHPWFCCCSRPSTASAGVRFDRPHAPAEAARHTMFEIPTKPSEPPGGDEALTWNPVGRRVQRVMGVRVRPLRLSMPQGAAKTRRISERGRPCHSQLRS